MGVIRTASCAATAGALMLSATCSASHGSGVDGDRDSGAVADGSKQVSPSDASAGEAGSVDDATDAQRAGCSAAGALCWGFEEGKTPPPGWSLGRTDYGAVVLTRGVTNDPALLVDDTRPHTGLYALHARGFVGGDPTMQGGPKATLVYTLPDHFGPVLWGRAFVYIDPAVPLGHAGLFDARYPPPGSTSTATSTLDWYEVATYTQDYMTIWHPPEPPGVPEDVQVSGTAAVVDQYSCLEWLFDATQGDAGEAARPRAWLNGAELTWPMSFIYPDGSAPPTREPADSFTQIELGVFMYEGVETPTDWWIDDVGVSPTRLGCE
jgi:hypothetical protein